MKLKVGQIYEIRPGEWLRCDDPSAYVGEMLPQGEKFVLLSGPHDQNFVYPKLFSEYYFVLTNGKVRRIFADKATIMYIVGVHVP